MCLACCCEESNVDQCDLHYPKKLKRDGIEQMHSSYEHSQYLTLTMLRLYYIEKERYIDAGLEIQQQKKRRNFIHPEDKFDDYNQTVGE